MNAKTDADLLFEEYLLAARRCDALYEVPLGETTRVPDYQLPASPMPLLFEVKGFEVDQPAPGFGPGLVFLDPPFIFGAMLGDIAIEMPLDREAGRLRDEEARTVFSSAQGPVRAARFGGFCSCRCSRTVLPGWTLMALGATAGR